jgi:hypothetical protein
LSNDLTGDAAVSPIQQARVKDPGEEGGLNQSDFNTLYSWVTDPRTPDGWKLSNERTETFKAVAPLIDHSNPMMGTIDQSGHLQAARYMAAIRAAEEEYKNTPGKNVHDLFNPNKPDYVGRPEFYMPYTTSLDSSIQRVGSGLGVTQQSTPAIPDLKPGPDGKVHLKIGGRSFTVDPKDMQ